MWLSGIRVSQYILPRSPKSGKQRDLNRRVLLHEGLGSEQNSICDTSTELHHQGWECDVRGLVANVRTLALRMHSDNLALSLYRICLYTVTVLQKAVLLVVETALDISVLRTSCIYCYSRV